MKHLILTSALFLTATLGFAQNITEPEYKGQVAVINTEALQRFSRRKLENTRQSLQLSPWFQFQELPFLTEQKLTSL